MQPRIEQAAKIPDMTERDVKKVIRFSLSLNPSKPGSPRQATKNNGASNVTAPSISKTSSNFIEITACYFLGEQHRSTIEPFTDESNF
jgi:hypothetical protein